MLWLMEGCTVLVKVVSQRETEETGFKPSSVNYCI
jgi:hypothetical protein